MVASVLDRDPPSCVIALGLIIRGSTEHGDLVARSVTDALQKLAVESLRPIIHEVLLVDDEKQAYARCIGAQLNRGREAARAAAAIIDVFRSSTAPCRATPWPRNTDMPSRRQIREAAVQLISLLRRSRRRRGSRRAARSVLGLCHGSGPPQPPARHLPHRPPPRPRARRTPRGVCCTRQTAASTLLSAWPEAGSLKSALTRIAELESGWSTPRKTRTPAQGRR